MSPAFLEGPGVSYLEIPYCPSRRAGQREPSLDVSVLPAALKSHLSVSVGLNESFYSQCGQEERF